ncbi:restriction endonuclease [Paenibacillus pinisoli]|uniref:restriction endonuclease n=1 Tax=Paenibacillus pinisoli TaxID=1276110 RepID=UPI0031202EE6
MEDGSEFEMYLYRLFIELGYSNVYKTVGSRDFGADIVFTDREGIRKVVQAKRYTDSGFGGRKCSTGGILLYEVL